MIHTLLRCLLAFMLLIPITTVNAQPAQPLTSQQQSLVTISALTAIGRLDSLKSQLAAGLDNGLTINEIKEALVQLYAYCGFPRSLNGINTFMNVLDERKAKGIQDKPGREFVARNKNGDTYERGRKVLETLTKTSQAKPAPGFGTFAPRIDAFLKEHLFADIFDSDVLTYAQRELVTISALAAMPGVESQLQSHLKVGMNTGITENELVQLADLIDRHISTTQANTVRKLLAKPLAPVVEPDIMVRIAEIDIFPEYLNEYKAILKEESSASVKKEPGVISIFPIYPKESPTQIRIVEIYANKAAYEVHLKTPHFQHYKTATQNMVKSLKLVDMERIDPETMLQIFEKLR